MGTVARPLYRRGIDLVVVRPIKVSRECVMPVGTMIKADGKARIAVEKPIFEDVEVEVTKMIEVEQEDGSLVEEEVTETVTESRPTGETKTVKKTVQFRQHQMRNWYTRRRVGPANAPWSNTMIESWGTDKHFVKPEVSGEPETAPEPDPMPEVEQDAIAEWNGTWIIGGYEGTYASAEAAEQALEAFRDDQEPEPETKEAGEAWD